MPGYRTWATGDTPSAADWNELHADPLQDDVAAAESTNATSYGDLTTVGPDVVKSLVNGQKVLVEVSCRLDAPAVATTEGFMSFAVSGAGTLAAADINACRMTSNTAASSEVGLSKASVFTAGATGSFTFRAKYRSTSGAATYTFRDRRIIIKPF